MSNKSLIGKPVYNKNILKTKIKSHDNKVTDLHDKKICLAVISLDSAVKKDLNHDPQVVNILRKKQVNILLMT